MDTNPQFDAHEAPIVLGRASVATLGDIGMAEPEGGTPITGIAEE